MDLTYSISNTLIVIGAILMLINIISHRHTVKSTRSYRDRDSRLTRSLIRTHMAFMGFFFIGYILVLFFFLNHITFDSSIAVAIIFFFGAIFVFLGIIIQKRMLSSLEDKNAKLKKSNDNLLAEQDHLLQLNRQLELEMDSRVKAEESDQMKSDFLSLVSHELRTPLTSIYGFTKLIGKNLTKLDKGDGTDYTIKKKRMKANLEIIGSECARLSRLINNVLDLAKIESGRVEWNDQRISLRHIIDSSQAAVQGLVIDNLDVTLEVDVPAELPDLMVDPDLFTQVFVNLINNAVKYAEQGTIVLRAERRQHDVHIAVSDNGPGIPEEKLKKIFDKFYIVRKGDTLGSKSSGTGLGLPICKEIVEHYDGKIWVESEQGKGSTFHITLPAKIAVN